MIGEDFPGAPKIDIDLDKFSVIPPGKDNAGMLLEDRPRIIFLNEVQFLERRVLLECKLTVKGEPTGEEEIINDFTYSLLKKKGEPELTKYVQKTNSSSMQEIQGKIFCCWTTFEEVTPAVARNWEI